MPETKEAESPEIKSAITEYSSTEAALSELRSKYKSVIYEVSKAQGMADAIKARAEVRAWRVGLEKERVKIKAPALERCRLIDTEAKRITAELEALEIPIDKQIKDEETRKEREKQAKIETEAARVAEIQLKISNIRNIPLSLSGMTSKQIEEVSDKLRNMEITEADFQEFHQMALSVYQETLSVVNTIHAGKVAEEAEKSRIIAERAELEKLRKEQDEREAEAKKLREAEEAKIRAEREAEEKRAAQARKAEEKRLAEAKAKQDAIIKAELEKVRLEREAAMQKQKELEAKQAEIDRQKALQDEQARKAAEHLESLRQAKRDTTEQALMDILILARDEEGHPNAYMVRKEIAIIAEANISHEKEPKPRKHKKAESEVK